MDRVIEKLEEAGDLNETVNVLQRKLEAAATDTKATVVTKEIAARKNALQTRRGQTIAALEAALRRSDEDDAESHADALISLTQEVIRTYQQLIRMFGLENHSADN
jgi:hypothetical protein